MKKYSEKFIHEFNKLKGSVIGMEFEFYMKDLSFYKTLELMNLEFDPIKIHGFRQYHSDFKPDSKNFKIEPDLSGGSNMVELVTGPLDYNDAKYYLIKILKFIENYGYTNERCSIHFNISFKKGDLNDLNILKLILNTNEDEIYRYYPSRKDNIYAKSIKKIIPFKSYDFFDVPIESVKNILKLPNDKYFGINFLNTLKNKELQRVEYRYIGGTDYEKNIGNIVYFFDRFIIDLWNSLDVGFSQSDIELLSSYLEENLYKWKSFSKYSNFIVEYPSVQLQIDQSFSFDFINSYFPRIYSKLFELMESTEDLKDCIINFVTATQTMEIVDATVNSKLTLNKFEFINCRIGEGIYENCQFSGCAIDNVQVSKSLIDDCEISKSKVLSCRVNSSKLKDCFFMNGYLNSDMEGGVWRSGELGPYASISSSTKMIDTYDSFFSSKFSNDTKGDKKGIIDFKDYK
jgi:hypothetical protein